MSALKGLLAVLTTSFVTTAYAAPSAAVLNSLFGTIGIYVTLSVLAMIVSNMYFATDKNGEDTKYGADASIVALFAAMAAGLVFCAIVALPVSLTNFAAVLAALVIATLAAFFTCASHLTIAVDRKVYVMSAAVFYVAMAVCTYTVVFGL